MIRCEPGSKLNRTRTKAPKGTLHSAVMELLDTSPMRGAEICHGTGLDPAWLSSLKKGRFAEPGVNKMQILYEFLTDNKLVF